MHIRAFGGWPTFGGDQKWGRALLPGRSGPTRRDDGPVCHLRLPTRASEKRAGPGWADGAAEEKNSSSQSSVLFVFGMGKAARWALLLAWTLACTGWTGPGINIVAAQKPTRRECKAGSRAKAFVCVCAL